MKTLIIRRVVNNDVSGMFGVMVNNNVPFAVTLEPSWLNNEPMVSCIPSGTYTCQRTLSPHFGNVFEVMNVQGRSHVLLHKGNTIHDTLGCITVAESFDKINSIDGIANSSHGFDEMMGILQDTNVFRLIIVDDWKNPLSEEI